MKCTILQPGYLPWLGFFDQMAQSDVFVMYDDVQYTRRDWRSRNRIKTAKGVCWLTVPVKTRGRRYQLVNEARVDNSRPWQRKHVETIRGSYSNAPYFKRYFPQIKSILEKDPPLLMDLNLELIQYLRQVLNLKTKIIFSSTMDIQGNRTERLVKICKALGAREYLTGDAAASYLEMEMFDQHDIEVHFHKYEHPEYPQINGPFIPYLSAIDLVFNCGPESRSYIAGRET
jgi:hypothetical protein